MTTSNVSGPLAGIRIVDMTTVLMGPFATTILGDMGADVIKVESPGGDGSRNIGPMRESGMGALFMHANRSKRSVVLDLKTAQGHEALQRLLKTADVLIYNVRPQAMARLRLSYDEVLAINPRIIYVGTYGFGQNGPYAARPAYDDLIQAAVGLPSLAMRSGAAHPSYVPCTIADRTVGLHAVSAVTAALFHRERTGQGQAIGIPMFETMAQFVLGDHMAGLTFDPPAGPSGYQRLLAAERRPYATLDGHISAVVYTDRHWRDFLTLIGQPGLFESDPRFASMESRTRHIDALYGIVSDAIATRSTAEWVQVLGEIDIPVVPLHTMETLLEDPHLQAVGFFEWVEQPDGTRVRSISVPSTWSRSQPRASRLAPRMGEHTAEVLREIGYTPTEVEELLTCGGASGHGAAAPPPA